MRVLLKWLGASWVSLVAWSLTGAIAPAQATDPALAKVFADWKKRLSRFQSARYRVSGERTSTPNNLVAIDDQGRPVKQEKTTSENVSMKKSFLLLLDFPTSRHRLEERQQLYDFQRRQFFPRVTTEAFDGKVKRTAIPRAENNGEGHEQPATTPDVSIQTSGFSNFIPDYWAILVNHGLIPTVHRQISRGQLGVKPDEEVYYVHGRGKHASRDCLVVRTHAVRGHDSPSFDEFWVDETRDSAVVRLVRFLRDVPWIDIDIAYQETGHGWMPMKWTWVYRDFGGKTRFIERMRVDEVAADVPCADDDFQVVLKPGMLVTRTEVTDAPDPLRGNEGITEKTFRVNDNGQLVEIVNGVEVKGWSSYAWLVVPPVFLIAMVIWVMFRRKPCPSKEVMS
jgi:hypothetical protein